MVLVVLGVGLVTLEIVSLTNKIIVCVCVCQCWGLCAGVVRSPCKKYCARRTAQPFWVVHRGCAPIVRSPGQKYCALRTAQPFWVVRDSVFSVAQPVQPLCEILFVEIVFC